MPFELQINLSQLDSFAARMGGFDQRLRRALVRAITRATLLVEARAKQLVSGEVLKVRTGTLRRSISHRPIEQLADRVRGVVSASAKYARIHELGGEIRPVRARALRFQVEGRWVTVQRVRMPERSYLRRALRESGGQIRAEIRQAVREAAAFGGGSVEV